MANAEHLKKFKEGHKAFNAWRKENPDIKPDLSGMEPDDYVSSRSKHGYIPADFSKFNLCDVNISFADLSDAPMSFAQLASATGVPSAIPYLIIESDPRMQAYSANLPPDYVSDPHFGDVHYASEKDIMPEILDVRKQMPQREAWIKEQIRNSSLPETPILKALHDEVEVMFRRNEEGYRGEQALEDWKIFVTEELENRKHATSVKRGGWTSEIGERGDFQLG